MHPDTSHNHTGMVCMVSEFVETVFLNLQGLGYVIPWRMRCSFTRAGSNCPHAEIKLPFSKALEESAQQKPLVSPPTRQPQCWRSTQSASKHPTQRDTLNSSSYAIKLNSPKSGRGFYTPPRNANVPVYSSSCILCALPFRTSQKALAHERGL